MSKLILCGFVCAGKTTIGKECAKQLSLPFWDTDWEIEASYEGRKVWEIYKELGDDQFRQLEGKILDKLGNERGVLAVGGGTLLSEKNRARLKQIGYSVYLKTSFPILFSRMSKRGLPSYLNSQDPQSECEMIAQQRFPIYEMHCDWTLLTEQLTEKELADTICSHYSRFLNGK